MLPKVVLPSMLSDINDICRSFVSRHHPNAAGAFFYGSMAAGKNKIKSDIDLIILYINPVSVKRNIVEWHGQIMDTFIYDAEALHGAMILARANGNTVLAQCIGSARIINAQAEAVLNKLQAIANRITQAPVLPRTLVTLRYQLQTLTDDLRVAEDSSERLFVASDVFDTILEILMTKYGALGGAKRFAMKRLKREDPEFFRMFVSAYENAVNGSIEQFLSLAENVILITGGQLRYPVEIKLPEGLRIPMD